MAKIKTLQIRTSYTIIIEDIEVPDDIKSELENIYHDLGGEFDVAEFSPELQMLVHNKVKEELADYFEWEIDYLETEE